ncbi:MAG: hypothetical protein IKS10_03925 [Lachnospiraceae bacterium]|nr:hypothetical protein [Lachnospiraceae bacterium]
MDRISELRDAYIMEAEYTEEEMKRLQASDTEKKGGTAAVKESPNKQDERIQGYFPMQTGEEDDEPEMKPTAAPKHKATSILWITMGVTLAAAAILLFVFLWNPNWKDVVTTTEEQTEATSEVESETTIEAEAETTNEAETVVAPEDALLVIDVRNWSGLYDKNSGLYDKDILSFQTLTFATLKPGDVLWEEKYLDESTGEERIERGLYVSEIDDQKLVLMKKGLCTDEISDDTITLYPWDIKSLSTPTSYSGTMLSVFYRAHEEDTDVTWERGDPVLTIRVEDENDGSVSERSYKFSKLKKGDILWERDNREDNGDYYKIAVDEKGINQLITPQDNTEKDKWEEEKDRTRLLLGLWGVFPVDGAPHNFGDDIPDRYTLTTFPIGKTVIVETRPTDPGIKVYITYTHPTYIYVDQIIR